MFFLKDLPTKAMIQGYQQKYHELDVTQVEQALQTMRQASLMIRQLEEYFAKHNLSQLRFLILMVIDREPTRNELTAIEIAQRLDVSKPVLSRAIKRLVDDGVLNCEENTQDKRAKCLSLTESGKTLLTQVLPNYFKLLGQF